MTQPACDLCGGSRFSVVYEDCEDVIYRVPGPSFSVLRCLECGLARTDPRPDPEEMERWYGPGYAEWSGAPRPGGGALRRILSAPYRVRFGGTEAPAPPRPGARSVEVGCGDGAGPRAMAEAGWDAWGIEPFARGAFEGFRLVRARAEDAELPEGDFDLVSFPHSLEHTGDPVGVLRRARTWLRPGGEVRVAVPNFDSIERRAFGPNWNGLDIPRHLNHFSRPTLRAALGAAGFKTISIRPQLQGSSFGGSLQHRSESRGDKRPYRPEGPLYMAGAAAGTLLSATPVAAFIEAVAVPAGEGATESAGTRPAG